MSIPSGAIVAYFSMEICLEQAIPTYSGGLGVLAGDTLRSAADLAVPIVAVTLLHRKGYFTQHLDANGQQHEAPVSWSPETVLAPVSARAHPSRSKAAASHIRAWNYGARRRRTRCAGLSARHAARREQRVGSHAHRLSLRRRQSLPPVSGSRARHGRRRAPRSDGLRGRRAVPHERRTLGALTLCLLERAARRARAPRAERSGSRARAAALRLHDAHAGARGPRQVPTKASIATCSATSARSSWSMRSVIEDRRST